MVRAEEKDFPVVQSRICSSAWEVDVAWRMGHVMHEGARDASLLPLFCCRNGDGWEHMGTRTRRVAGLASKFLAGSSKAPPMTWCLGRLSLHRGCFSAAAPPPNGDSRTFGFHEKIVHDPSLALVLRTRFHARSVIAFASLSTANYLDPATSRNHRYVQLRRLTLPQ